MRTTCLAKLRYGLVLWLGAMLAIVATPAWSYEPLQEQIVFARGWWGYDTFRIPALYETQNGVLLAFAEGRVNSASDTGNIDTVLRRSFDGGQTWQLMQLVWSDGGNTCGNPTVLQDPHNGRVWLFSTHNLGQDTQSEIANGTSDGVRTIWSCYSDDDGATWSTPYCHYPAIGPFSPPNGWDATGPGRGLVLAHGPHVGRLIIPAIERNIYSDDHGMTWQEGGFLQPGSSEAQVVELTNGALLRNDRATGAYKAYNRRIMCLSYDQGGSWEPLFVANELVTPICQASTIGLPSDLGEGGKFYVFSNPSALTRIRMTVQYSYTNAMTWPIDKLIHTGPSGYSCLTGIGNDYIGLLYEGGSSNYYDAIRFAKFRRDWVPETTVFRWDFEEFATPQVLAGGSVVRDSRGYGYDGEVAAALPVIAATIGSRQGMAVSFDGTSGQGIVLGDSNSQHMLDLEEGQSLTIKVTFRTTSHVSGGSVGAGGLVSKDVGPGQPSWWMRVQDGLVRFYMEDGTNVIALWSDAGVSDGAWHTVRVVRDVSQGQAHLYLDGNLEDTLTDEIPGAVANSNAVVVGKFNAAVRDFVGDIALVEISKSASHADECGDWGYASMDFNRDCYVNLFDLADFAEQWLACTAPGVPGCYDLH